MAQQLKEARFQRHGWPVTADRIFDIRSLSGKTVDSFFELAIKFLPFVLVMWSLAGALYPAVDLCAGEKERGTMETLLISPASREEIVYGKFLTIWVFSAGTAFLNLASMGLCTWQMRGQLPHDVLRPAALLSCIVLALPLSAFFSAVCLAVGAYARSSKEGQYYLMPLFLVTLPLILVTLSGDVKLLPFTSLVPVTGVALLMQDLMNAKRWIKFPGVTSCRCWHPLPSIAGWRCAGRLSNSSARECCSAKPNAWTLGYGSSVCSAKRRLCRARVKQCSALLLSSFCAAFLSFWAVNSCTSSCSFGQGSARSPS